MRLASRQKPLGAFQQPDLLSMNFDLAQRYLELFFFTGGFRSSCHQSSSSTGVGLNFDQIAKVHREE